MPSILSVPPNDTNIVQVELSKDNMIIDARVIGMDRYAWRFECTIHRNTLTLRRIDKYEGWYSTLHFRLYDPAVENVPKFDSKSYRYHGLENEGAPFEVEEVIVDSSVKHIKEEAFFGCGKMKRCIMTDGVERIGRFAFHDCVSIKNIQLPRFLRCICVKAFAGCTSIDILFLPPDVEEIQHGAFMNCTRMKILVFPTNIDLERVGQVLTRGCSALLTDPTVQYNRYRATNNREVNHWMKHRYDRSPLLRLCSDPGITAQMIYGFIQEHGTKPFYRIDDGHQLTPLHILAHFNAYAGVDAIVTCYDANPGALFTSDSAGMTPLDYLWADGKLDTIMYLMRDMCINRYTKC